MKRLSILLILALLLINPTANAVEADIASVSEEAEVESLDQTFDNAETSPDSQSDNDTEDSAITPVSEEIISEETTLGDITPEDVPVEETVFEENFAEEEYPEDDYIEIEPEALEEVEIYASSEEFVAEPLSFSNPFTYTETFPISKSPLAETAGDEINYSQYTSVKYWEGSDPANLNIESGILPLKAREIYTVSTTQPVCGSYTYEFDLTHPTYNNLNSAFYIGMRSTEQFKNFGGTSFSELPADGIWFGIVNNYVGIGTGLLGGNLSKRYLMREDFSSFTHFTICDDRDNNVIYYFAENLQTQESFLFARVDIAIDETNGTSTLTYNINTADGITMYEATVEGVVPCAQDAVYPQIFFSKYLCNLTGFSVTSEANPDSVLTALNLTGAEISPDFSFDNTEYTLKLPRGGTVNLEVTGTPGIVYEVYIDETPVPMAFGENVISIAGAAILSVISDNGIESKAYTFTIIDNTHTVKLTPTFCTIIDADEDGTKSTNIPDGEGVSFEITPVPGYDFSSVSEGATYENGVVTVDNVTADMNIDIVFVRRVPIYLTVGTVEAAQGETVDIPINIAENSGATSGAFNVLFDSCRLEYVSGVRTGCLSLGNAGLDPVPNVDGKLGFYFIARNFGQTPITAGGTLVYVRLRVKDDAPDGEAFISIVAESNESVTAGITDADGPRLLDITPGGVNCITPDDGKHIIKFAADPEGTGTVSLGGRYTEGEYVSISAKAGTGYEFSHWTSEFGSFSDPNMPSCTYTVGNSSDTVTAHFKIKTLNINTSVTGEEGGEIIPSATTINYGGSVTVTLKPMPGYEVSAFTVGGRDRLSSLVDNVYTLSNIRSNQTMVVTYRWIGTDIITGITGLRAYNVQYDNTAKTISFKASNVNTSAGFSLDIANNGDYSPEGGKNIAIGRKDGNTYMVARRRCGNVQTFLLYINYEGYEYTYTVTAEFTDDPTSVEISDAIAYNAFSVDLDTITREIYITADKYKKDSIAFSLVLPQGTITSYNVVSSTLGGRDIYLVDSSEYINTEGLTGTYGNKQLIMVPVSNGIRQTLSVTITDDINTNEYTVYIAFRDCSYPGDVRPTELVPLRLTNYRIDTENKTIYAEAPISTNSAGFSYRINGNPPAKFTTLSGQNLMYGYSGSYKYVVNRRSFGIEQTYKVKIYGEDGYEYSWYTVTMKYV